MEILIDKTKVYEYAMALTARAGTATESYEKVAITKDNYPLLDVFLSEALVNAEAEFRKKLFSTHDLNMLVQENEIRLNFKDDLRVDTSVNGLLASSVRLYLAYYVACSWLLLSPAASAADVYRASAQTHLKTAMESLEQKETLSIPDDEYSYRKKDDLKIRPGHIIADEVLLIKADEGSELMEPAITCLGEHLTHDR